MNTVTNGTYDLNARYRQLANRRAELLWETMTAEWSAELRAVEDQMDELANELGDELLWDELRDWDIY